MEVDYSLALGKACEGIATLALGRACESVDSFVFRKVCEGVGFLAFWRACEEVTHWLLKLVKEQAPWLFKKACEGVDILAFGVWKRSKLCFYGCKHLWCYTGLCKLLSF